MTKPAEVLHNPQSNLAKRPASTLYLISSRKRHWKAFCKCQYKFVQKVENNNVQI